MKRLVKILDFILFFIFNLIIGLNPLTSLIISSIFLIGIYAFRTYDTETMNSLNETIIRVIAGNFVSIIGITLFHSILGYSISKVFLYNFIFNIILIPTIHKIEYMIYIKKAPEKRYLVIGRKNEIGHILDEISKKTHGKYKFVKYINPSAEKLNSIVSQNYDIDPGTLYKKKAKMNKKYRMKNDKKVDFCYIVVTDLKLEQEVMEQIDYYKQMGIHVEYLPELAEKTLKRVPIEVIERFDMYYKIEFEKSYDNSPAKRLLDYVVSIIALTLFSPFMLIIFLGVLLEDGFPIVFKQKRMGLYSNPFTLFKFRSLKEVPIDKNNPNNGIENRVLKIGKFSRKSRLDESLQFINVLKGDMSIVGSRPEMEEFHDQMIDKINFYKYRLKLKPGITGWAQINYKHTSTLEDYKIKTEYDLYYIKNRNIIFDLQIMLKTIETMLGMRGAR